MPNKEIEVKSLFDLTNSEIVDKVRAIAEHYNCSVMRVDIGRKGKSSIAINILYDARKDNKIFRSRVRGFLLGIDDMDGNEVCPESECPYSEYNSPLIMLTDYKDTEGVEISNKHLMKIGDITCLELQKVGD